MTAAHWAILAAAAVAAVLWLWWTRRRPRIRTSHTAGVEDDAARQTWTDEPGDPTHEQIDEALTVIAADKELMLDIVAAFGHDHRKSEHLDGALRRVEGGDDLVPWPHLTVEEAAVCLLCGSIGHRGQP